ncbi:MAG TPA: hypothetical protein VF258_10010, partial [Luteolibacter sp.]
MASTNFTSIVANNPMRTFYFDTGLYGAARIATQLGLPKVQYVTTRRSMIGKTKNDPGRRMLQSILNDVGGGIEFYL